ncbi:MAG: hypothetical protein HUJ52_01385 [Malacoplasma sp.]|nr:hypothetical protein [Malacoplasma sp.]
MTQKIIKEKTSKIEPSHPKNKTSELGTATWIVALIFIILCGIGFISIAWFYWWPCILLLPWAIISTVFIIIKCKNGEHLNLAISICTLIFYNLVVGVLAIVYSCLTPKK